MNWNLDKNRPICPQLCQQLCAGIAAGQLLPGQKLMSVRELALTAGVNPNTVQHAFNQLEQQGVLYSVRGTGWFVSADISASLEVRESMICDNLKLFFEEMSGLGLTPEEIKTRVKEWEYE